MMKGRKRGPARALAIMLSAILMVSSMGLTVSAYEQIPADEQVIVEGSTDLQQAEEDIVQSVENATEESTEEPDDELAKDTADALAEGLTEEPAEDPADDLAEGPSDAVAEGSAEELTVGPTEEPAEGSADELTEGPADDLDEIPADDPSEEPSKEPADKPADAGSAGDPADGNQSDEALSEAVTDESENAPLADVDTAVTYIERRWDGKKVVDEEKTRSEDISPFPNSTSVPAGWYYVDGKVTVKDRVSLSGDTYLILSDGCELNVRGLYIPKGSTLTIYGQSKDSGQLNSDPDGKGGTAIGAYSKHEGGEIIIHGGTITAEGDNHCAAIGSNDGDGTAGNITIYGGTIKATAGSNSAGIGGGRYCDAHTILIYGGDVTAVGKGNSAGIGGGDPGEGHNGNGGLIQITGGTVNATGSGKGAGIGGSQKGTAEIHIEGGVIKAGSGSSGVGIGLGAEAAATGEDIDIYLGWTSVSKDTISITSSSYRGNVRLSESFCNDSRIIKSGGISDNSILAEDTLTAWDGIITSWDELQKAIDISVEETILQLGCDITATETDTCLEVPSGKSVLLDLNGCTLNRGLEKLIDNIEASVDGGGVLHVQSGAEIFIYDGKQAGGTIRGGCNSAEGGGIFNEGRVFLEDFTLTRCGAPFGGGIYNKGELNLKNCTITRNDALTNGGGIYNAPEGTLYAEGKPVVTGNYSTDVPNILLEYPTKLSVSGRLDNDARLGVTLWHYRSVSGIISSGLSGKGIAANFVSDNISYMPVLNSDGEAELIARPEVKINGVTGSFNDKIKLNYYFDLPENVRADEGAYVTITNDKNNKTSTIPLSEAEYVEGKGWKFSIELVAKEASDTITAKVFESRGNALRIIGTQNGIDYTDSGVQYSLMRYFTWLEAEGSGNEKRVGVAAKDYCAAAQVYFDYNADGVTVSSAVDAVTAETLRSYVAGRSGTLPEGVSVKGISAMLESDNTLRLYYGFKDVDPAKLTFTVDGEIVELKKRKDGQFYLALDYGVYSNHLQDTHTYSVSDNTNTYTITASVLTYARSCAIKSDEATSNLGKALYLYNKAAVAAFGN